jgi:alpha-mannosidase
MLSFGTAGSRPVVCDQPYGVSEVTPQGTHPKKYPTGDWMTSPQWFEEVEKPFTGLTFVDLQALSGGLLVLHDGSQQWLERDGAYWNVVNAYDPWDEEHFVDDFDARFRIVPHVEIGHSERWRLAQEFRRPLHVAELEQREPGGDLPSVFEPLRVQPHNVLASALYRETRDSGRHVQGYGANRFEADYPFVLRLVELDGLETVAEVDVAGTVASAVKTNLLGEAEQTLAVSEQGQRSSLSVPLRSYEIATIYMDIVEGRKQTRDLDAARNVWATVHRVEE